MILPRAIIPLLTGWGTFHKVTKKYLHLYVNEFEFRYNQRLNADIFGAVIKVC